MNEFEKTNKILKKYNIRANKALGQNFLIDDEIIESIIEKADINKEDTVIEIGPGLGVLTEKLLEKAKQVICVELDKKMIQILEERFVSSTNLQILNQDILKTDLKKLIGEIVSSETPSVKVVANLPYYITTPIIMKLLEEKLDIQTITVMVQKEVAQRLTAEPGSKFGGAITYTVNYYSEATMIIDVQSNSFIPEPEVDSGVIQLKIRKEKPVNLKDEDLFFRIIKQTYMQRRKTLLNSLFSSKIYDDKEFIKKMFKLLGIEENIRCEKLTMQDYEKITNYTVENLQNSPKEIFTK